MQKRSITIKGHRTSVSLEPEFWDVLSSLAKAEGLSLANLIAEIDRTRTAASTPSGLASALRVYVLTRLVGRT